MHRALSARFFRSTRALTALVALTVGPFTHAQTFSAVNLGTLGGSGTSAYAINSSGTVVG